MLQRNGKIDRQVGEIAESSVAGSRRSTSSTAPAISIFGSAEPRPRTSYELARATGRFAERGWVVVTGGGPGIMRRPTAGVATRWPSVASTSGSHEQGDNAYLDVALEFSHFYARKTMRS